MAIDQNKLNDLFGGDWGKELKGDLDFGDDGELAFDEDDSESDESEDSNDLNDGESDDADVESSDDDSEASDGEDESDSGESDEVDPVETRFQSLESSVDKLTALLEQVAEAIKTGKTQTQTGETEEDDDDDDIPLTRKELRKMMEDTVKKAVQPIQRETAEQKEAKVVNDLLTKHGDDFKTAIPAMKKILAINPEMGVAKAWEMYNDIKGAKVKPKATTKDSDSKKVLPKKKGDAAALRDKAASVNTVKGVSGTNKDKKRATGINDIIKLSWDEMFEAGG